MNSHRLLFRLLCAGSFVRCFDGECGCSAGVFWFLSGGSEGEEISALGIAGCSSAESVVLWMVIELIF